MAVLPGRDFPESETVTCRVEFRGETYAIEYSVHSLIDPGIRSHCVDGFTRLLLEIARKIGSEESVPQFPTKPSIVKTFAGFRCP